MFKAVSNPYLVPSDGSFKCAEAPTGPSDSKTGKKIYKKKLKKLVSQIFITKILPIRCEFFPQIEKT